MQLKLNLRLLLELCSYLFLYFFIHILNVSTVMEENIEIF